MWQQIRSKKQETVQLSRDAVQKMKEARALAENQCRCLESNPVSRLLTFQYLIKALDQIANVDRNIDRAMAYSKEAANKAQVLERMTGSFLNPVNYVTRSSKNKKVEENDSYAKDRETQNNIVRRSGTP